MGTAGGGPFLGFQIRILRVQPLVKSVSHRRVFSAVPVSLFRPRFVFLEPTEYASWKPAWFSGKRWREKHHKRKQGGSNHPQSIDLH